MDYINLSDRTQKSMSTATPRGIIIIIIIIIKYEKITVTLSQPNVAGVLYKVNEDMPMSVDA